MYRLESPCLPGVPVCCHEDPESVVARPDPDRLATQIEGCHTPFHGFSHLLGRDLTSTHGLEQRLVLLVGDLVAEADQVCPQGADQPRILHRLLQAEMRLVRLQVQTVEDEDWCSMRLQHLHDVGRNPGDIRHVRHGVLDDEAQTQELLLRGC